MAYIRDSIYATETGTSVSVSSMPVHETDDLIIYLVGQDGSSGGNYSTPSGYDVIEGTTGGSVKASAFSKTATSSSESIPVSTTGGTGFSFCCVMSIADIDTADPINISNIVVQASSNTHTAPSMTTDEDKTLNIWWEVSDGDKWPSVPPGLMSVGVGIAQPVDVAAQGNAAWSFQYSLGVAETPAFLMGRPDTGITISIAINSSNSSPIIPVHCSFSSPPSDIVHHLRSGTDSTSVWGGGAFDPSTDFAAGIGPDSVPYNNLTPESSSGGGIRGLNPAFLTRSPGSASSVQEFWGTGWDLSGGNVDLSGKKIAVHIQVPSANIGTIGAASGGSVIFGLRTDDGGGDAYRLWNIGGIDTLPSLLTQHSVVADVDSTTLSFEDFGTVDETAVSGLIMMGHKTADTRYQATYTEMHSLNTIILLGGDGSLPANLQGFVDSLQAARLLTITNQAGSSSKQLFSLHDMQVGNGTDSVNFQETNASVEFGKTASLLGKTLQFAVGSGGVGFGFYAVSGDTISYTNSSITSDTTWNFDIVSGSTSAATWDFTGLAVINANVVLRDVFTATSGMKFIDCPTLAQNSANLSVADGASFDNTLVTITAETTGTQALSDVSNCTFSNRDGGGESAILITGNQTGTWTEKNLIVSNNTFDIEYTGTTNFSLASAATLTVNNSSSGVLTISTPVLTLNINSDTATTLIRYFEDDSQTVVDSATGTTLAYNFPDTDVIDIELVKQSYVPINSQDVVPFDGNINFIMDFDESYNSGHGLTITTEYDYVRATKVLTINSDQNALDVRSSLADVIRTNSSYFNTPLLMMSIPGLTRVDLTDGMTITSMLTWKGAGMEMFDAADALNPLEKWFALKSGGTITGATTHYRQTDSGNSTAVTLTNNVVDEAFQYWDDPNHDGSTADGFDFSDYMVTKAFLAGSKQARSDLLVDAGISAIASNSYQVVLANADHGYSGSDPGITGDLTLVTGGTFGGKVFAYEIIDGGVNTGADIADQFNFNAAVNPNTVIPGGTGLRYFELNDMVIHNATAVETERGFEEGTTPTLVGFYCSRASADHPGFTRFQADDGTYFTPAVTSNVLITGMPAAGNEIRLQIYNVTAQTASAWASTTVYTEGDKVLRSTGLGTEQTAGLYFVATTGGTSGGSEPTWDTTVENTTADNTVTWTTFAILFTDADPVGTGFADSYTDGEEFIATDTFRVRFAELNTTTSFKTFETTGIVSASGFAVAVDAIADSVYAINGIDGSSTAVTDIYTADYANNEIDLDTNMDFTNPKSFAFVSFEQTTSQGMFQIWDIVTAIDAANYLNNVGVLGILFDETSGFVKQEDGDTSRWYRSDGARPFKDPTTGGNGISMNWKNPVFTISTGSVLTALEKSQLATSASESTDANTKLGTPAVDVSADIATRMPTTHIAATAGKVDGVALVDTTTANTDMRGTDSSSTFNPATDTVANVTLVATTTTNTDMRGTDSANTIAPDNTGIADIKAKTDSLTFTKANELDSNIQSVNDVTVTGTGTAEDPWGPE